VNLRKYWVDILRPVLARVEPPTVPQAVVFSGESVLLVRRDNPALWELPGGSMHPGETAEQAARREVEEETGVCIEIVGLLGWYERTGFRAHRSPVFVCRPLHAHPPPPSDDVVDVRYFPLAALPRNLFPWFRPILDDAVTAGRSAPLERRQHLGALVVLQCAWLDLSARLGLIR